MKLRLSQQVRLLRIRNLTGLCWLPGPNLRLNQNSLRSTTSSSDDLREWHPILCNNNLDSYSISKTRTFRTLPLSHIMDPKLIAAREKHRTPKPVSRGELTPLQNKLKRNPYASALETSLRQCSITGARLPEFFLFRYHLALHPETGDPWYLPANLETSTDVSESTDIAGDKSEAENHSALERFLPVQPKNPPARRRGPVSLVLARADLLESPKAGRNKKRGALTWQRLNLGHATQIGSHDVVWREDMPAFVLRLLRWRVRHELLKVARRGISSNICRSWSEVIKKEKAACVLWLEHAAIATNIPDDGPVPYATTNSASGKQIVIYNIPRLLGPEIAEEVRSAFCPDGRAEAVVLKSWHSTRQPQGWLWKLEGYISEVGDQQHILK